MNGERRLRLVPPAGPPGGRDELQGDEPRGEPPASEEELREARLLAETLERGDDPLASALRAAAMPADLDALDHDALIARALGDEAAAPTRAERRAAERLRDALDGRGRAPAAVEGEQAELAAALRAAWEPAPLPELRNEALIARALARHERRDRGLDRRRRALPVTMAALSTLAAAAAAVAIFFFAQGDKAPAPGAAALISARSTAALFDPATPFPREGGETARIDRITSARAADLRANRYAAWGVR